MLDKKTFWKNALNWGCLLGVVLFLISLAWALLGLKSGFANTVLTVAVIAAVIFVSGRQNAALADKAGYPYARAFGFVLATMLFAGVLVGIGSWFLQHIIAPEYYEAQLAAGLAAAGPQAEEAAGMMAGVMKNPIVMLFSGVLSMVFMGGLTGLVVCAFVTRKPDMFAAE